MIRYLLVFIFFIAALLDVFGILNITEQFLTMLPFMFLIYILSFFLKLNGKSYFIVALIFLVFSIYQLSIKDLSIAEKTAVWCYMFIFEGLLLSTFSKNK